MTNRPAWPPADLAIYLGAIAVVEILIAIVLGPAWTGVWAIGGFIAANVAVKLLHPANALLRGSSRSSLLVVGVLMASALYLFANPNLLGGWTLIVVFGLFVLYGLGSLIVATRGQGRSSGENDHGPH